jgi:hypothetical protein
MAASWSVEHARQSSAEWIEAAFVMPDEFIQNRMPSLTAAWTTIFHGQGALAPMIGMLAATWKAQGAGDDGDCR